MSTLTAVRPEELTEQQFRRQRGEQMQAELRKAGIEAQMYKKVPSNPAVFLMAIVRDTLFFWPGDAELEVLPDRKHRQAVINVIEKRRKVEQTYRAEGRLPKKWNGKGTMPNNLWRRFVQRFPVRFPNHDSVTFALKPGSAQFIKAEPRITAYDDPWHTYSATIVATVPASRQTFLVGKDEHSAFVSMLPRKATSVTHAHKILRPPGVSETTPRQGEWFFRPVSAALSKELDAILKRRPDALDHPKELGRSTTHFAPFVTFKNRKYALGWVTDRREGSKAHHEPLWLGEWSEVIRNLEIEPPVTQSRRASFD